MGRRDAQLGTRKMTRPEWLSKPTSTVWQDGYDEGYDWEAKGWSRWS